MSKQQKKLFEYLTTNGFKVIGSRINTFTGKRDTHLFNNTTKEELTLHE